MIVGAALDTIAGGIPDDIRADYLACYDGDRFAEEPKEYASTVVDLITGKWP